MKKKLTAAAVAITLSTTMFGAVGGGTANADARPCGRTHWHSWSRSYTVIDSVNKTLNQAHSGKGHKLWEEEWTRTVISNGRIVYRKSLGFTHCLIVS